MSRLAVLWHAFTHATDVAWHGLLYVYAAAYGLWAASIAYNVACERLQRRRDRRARLAAQLRAHADHGCCSGCADAPRRVREVIGDWDDAMVAELMGGNA